MIKKLVLFLLCSTFTAIAQAPSNSAYFGPYTQNKLPKVCQYLNGYPLYCDSKVTDDGTHLLYNGQVVGAGTINAALLPHWIACTAKVKINAGNCRVYAVGDSTVWGSFSLNTGNTGNVVTASYPTRLSQYLNNTILPTQRDSFMGDGGFPSNLSVSQSGAADARVTLGSFAPTGIASTGGAVFAAGAGSTPMAFLPLDSVDTFRVWYVDTAPGTFSWNIDGGSPTTITGGGTMIVKSFTTTAVTPGSHTLNLTWLTGNDWIVGEEAYNSTVGSVQIINAGWPASLSGDWNSAAGYNPKAAIIAQTPDVVLIDLGINDWGASIPVATYTANIQALITAWKTNSDIILVTPAPSATVSTPLATQQLYVTALQQLAATNNVTIIDNWSRWVSFELKNPAPFLFYSNSLHPNANGYSDFAQSVASQLTSIVGH